MKKRLLPLLAFLMSLFVITAVISSCNGDNINSENPQTSSESRGASSESIAGESSYVSGDNETSTDGTDSEPDESQPEESPEESDGESSVPDESSEDDPVIIDPNLPYNNIKNLTKNDIGTDTLDNYFENAVFIGDSITVHFKNFYDNMKSKDSGFLGKANFFCRSNYSAKTDLGEVNDDSWHPLYSGDKMKASDAVKAMGADTVYYSIMTLNEMATYSLSSCVNDNYKSTVKVLDEIREKNPGIKIVLLSNTYLVKSFNDRYTKLCNKNISLLNNMLLDYCNENDMDFIDVATPFVKNGCLEDRFCRDGEYGASGNSGCHLISDCYAGWTAILRNYAHAKQNGTYKNPDNLPVYEK